MADASRNEEKPDPVNNIQLKFSGKIFKVKYDYNQEKGDTEEIDLVKNESDYRVIFRVMRASVVKILDQSRIIPPDLAEKLKIEPKKSRSVELFVSETHACVKKQWSCCP
ncbi:hypothetical protein Btru_023706 [Bulinus truncatus]|nr:hypothetical protein Btru_023706 [Bulinus truncatus]